MRLAALIFVLLVPVAVPRAAEPPPVASNGSSAPWPAARTPLERALLRYYTAVNDGNFDAALAELGETFHSEAAFPGGKKNDRAGFREFLVMLRTAFPDARIEIVEFIGDGDTTVCRYTFSGTHRAKFLNLRPTRKTATAGGLDIWRFQGDQIQMLQGHFDSLGLLVQLGLVPEVK